ncbi:MAG: class II aldolase/adducin family protein [Candidatus Zophobacter franzmannii]|jgi:L-fuculose-phosphate aldolase|nr:class II aldolase/adducin family protein [Candidatus Zophobacter franzmannii]
MDILKAKQEMIDVGKKLYQKGYLAATDGNISVKLSAHRFLVTASGIIKGALTEEDILLVDSQGETIDCTGKPSSEFKLHLAIYNQRADVKAICHTHSVHSSTLACAGLPLDKPFMSELIITLGSVPLLKYGTPGTEEIFADLNGKIESNSALLLEHHGAVVFGSELESVYQKVETLEHCAAVYINLLKIDRLRELSSDDVHKLQDIRKNLS